MNHVLEMKNITKTFSGVKALDNVSFNLKKGTVHALMGENGAGKSTLMKILSGLIQADNGEILLKSNKVKIENPNKALQLGIAMIHQELTPVPEMLVAENIFLGRERTKLGLLDYKKLYSDTEELFEHIGINVDPFKKMKALKVSEMQLVEIAKAVSYDSDIIIMDEPTSAITDREVYKLFDVINELKNKGRSIIYISHKLDEIFKISDNITVLRDGQYIGTKETANVDTNALISMMVGRELTDVYPEKNNKAGNIILSVRNLNLEKKFENISFDVRKGEILGIAGLMGSGRTEVMEAIFGLTKPDSGKIIIEGQEKKISNPKDAINEGLAFVTEDRKLEGLILPLSVRHNITLSSLSKISKLDFIQSREELKSVKQSVKSLKVKTNTIEQSVKSLSGGNQQKVVIAKWLMTNPKILILDEPTRGIDVGAKSEIYKLMLDFASKGFAIIMISSELPEVLGMSDRILVFHEKKISGELDKKSFTQENVMELATGNVKKG